MALVPATVQRMPARFNRAPTTDLVLPCTPMAVPHKSDVHPAER